MSRIFALILFPFLCFAQIPVKLPIIDGQRIKVEDAPHIARVVSAGQSLCTGALISPEVVLTAAHCLFDSYGTQIGSGDAVLVGLGSNIFRSRDVVIHPSYIYRRNAACSRGEVDAALIFLERAVTEISPVRVASTAPGIGERLSLYGFGLEGQGSTGMGFDLPPDGYLNVGFTEAELIRKGYIEWEFDPGEANTASGDSGGPAFHSQNGEDILSSITCGGGGNAEWGTHSINTRIDELAPWISQNVLGVSIAPPRPAKVRDLYFVKGDSINRKLPFEEVLGLPSWLKLSNGVLQGRAKEVGIYNLGVVTENFFGRTRSNFLLVVRPGHPFLRMGAVKAQGVDLTFSARLKSSPNPRSLTVIAAGKKVKFRLNQSGVGESGDGSRVTVSSRGGSRFLVSFRLKRAKLKSNESSLPVTVIINGRRNHGIFKVERSA